MSDRTEELQGPPADVEDLPDDEPDTGCDCRTKETRHYSATPLETIAGGKHRLAITYFSAVQCSDAPDQCSYTYRAWIDVERQLPPKPGKKRGTWERDQASIALTSFAIGDDVNMKVDDNASPPRRRELSVSLDRNRTPLKGSAKVTITAVLDSQPSMPMTITDDVKLCLPKGDEPDCSDDP
jgi:hypothetical protein